MSTQIDYSGAGAWANHVRALAIIESGEDPAALGDDGQARGLLQIHPARFRDLMILAGPLPFGLAMTWQELDIALAGLYFEFYRAHPVDQVVMAWRLGVHGVMLAGETDAKYYGRWLYAYNEITRA